MSASDSTTDAAVIAKWAAAIEDGNAPALTVAELDRLIALTPANDARALADLADARAIEVELAGGDVAADAGNGNDCPICHGTGEGLTDYAPCEWCNGRGFIPADAADDDLAWLDTYAVQVQADEWAVA